MSRSESPLPAGSTGAPLPALLERTLDVVAIAFAFVTVVAHLLVFVLGGSFRTFGLLALLALPVALVAWRGLASRPPAPRADAPAATLSWQARAVALLVGAVPLLLLTLGLPYLWFWAASVAYFATLFARSFRAPALPAAPASWTRSQTALLVGMMLAAALLTATLHRPDSDDGFLLNLSIWSLENPEKELLSEDGIHQPPGLPVAFPTYRAHSIELLYALLARWTGATPIAVAHLLLPPFGAALCLAASALFLALLLPRAWPAATASLFLFWLTMGDVHEGFANHALVRMFQGKSLLVTGLVPYLAFAIVRFLRSGRALDWLVVLALGISAAGLSATGLFVAPLVLGCVLFAASDFTASALRRSAACLATTLYALWLALELRGGVVEKLGIINSEAIYGYVKTFATSLSQGVGDGTFLHLQLLGLLAAPALAADLSRRRWLSGLLLVHFGLVTNPLLFELWMNHVTSAPVAWRLWWAIPLPALVAFSLAAAIEGTEAVSRRRLAAVLLVGGVALAAVPSKWAISPRNMVRLGAPGLKVPPGDYALAKRIRELTPRGASALVPRELAMWVTTLPAHPRVVAHKMNTLKVLAPNLGEGGLRQRVRLFAYVSGFGRDANAAAELDLALDELRIGLVARPLTLPWAEEVDGVLARRGFRSEVNGPYLFWVRATPGAGAG